MVKIMMLLMIAVMVFLSGLGAILLMHTHSIYKGGSQGSESVLSS